MYKRLGVTVGNINIPVAWIYATRRLNAIDIYWYYMSYKIEAQILLCMLHISKVNFEFTMACW